MYVSSRYAPNFDYHKRDKAILNLFFFLVLWERVLLQFIIFSFILLPLITN